jgi:hypothetical protein
MNGSGGDPGNSNGCKSTGNVGSGGGVSAAIEERYAGMHLVEAAAPNSATGETLRLLMRALKRRPSKEKESDEQNLAMRGITYVTSLFPLPATSHDETASGTFGRNVCWFRRISRRPQTLYSSR